MSRIKQNSVKGPIARTSLVWAMIAIGFGGLTYYLIGSSASQNRLILLSESARALGSFDTIEVPVAQKNAKPMVEADTEISQLSEEIMLAKISYSDLMARVQVLEEALGPQTASMGDKMDAPEATAAFSLGNESDAPSTTAAISIGENDSIGEFPLPEIDASAPSPEVSAPPPPSIEISSTEFGLELAATLSLSDGRSIWQEMVARYPDHLSNFEPRISIVETEGGRLELRLLAGPIRNAGIAASLCGELRAMGQTCNNTVFEGQALAMR